MNTHARTAFCMVACIVGTFGQEPAPNQDLEIARVTALLRQVDEHHAELLTLLELLNNEKDLTAEQSKRCDELRAEASSAYGGAQRIVEQLKTDKNAFDYPGLLAMGKLRFNSRLESYELSINLGSGVYALIHLDLRGYIKKIGRQVPIR